MIIRERQLVNLCDAFFPVVEEPISYGNFMGRSIHIPGYKAIVDKTSGNTLSVVSTKYRLVTNKEAYDIADYVVGIIFPGKTLRDFEVFNVIMPKTKGSCRIDLIIPNNFNELFGNERESWTPFVRISNSYNRTTTLKFEIGFCRWICLNGCIFDQMGVSFSLTHMGDISKREIDRLIANAKHVGEISNLWATFEQKMIELRNINVNISNVLPIYCKVFDIKVTPADRGKLTEAQKENLRAKAKQILKSSKDYFKEMGNNAYALMNVLTDYASFPEWTANPNNVVDGYQRKVGKWVDDFLKATKEKDFSLSKYLGDDYKDTADYLESLVPVE